MWTCKNCGEELEDNFESCWNCLAERGSTPQSASSEIPITGNTLDESQVNDEYEHQEDGGELSSINSGFTIFLKKYISLASAEFYIYWYRFHTKLRGEFWSRASVRRHHSCVLF